MITVFLMHPSNDIKGSKSTVLSGRSIVLGITGSIAAVETVKLARELIRHGANVIPVMSREATRIIHPNAIEFACGQKAITELTGAVEHVEHCGQREGRADILLIAPITANTLSKMACGIDDTPVTTFATTAVGTGMKVLVAPAMHETMYTNPIISNNINRLKEVGVEFVWPHMEEKKAKLASVEAITAACANAVNHRDKKMLVIAGPTAEPMDDMRIVTNRSSGRTGIAIARAAHMMGYDTELWYGHGITPPDYIPSKGFTTTASLLELIKENASSAYDVIINSAAISDYRPERTEGKIRSGADELTVHFHPNPKVIPYLKETFPRATLVGFKAESSMNEKGLKDRAIALLKKYNLSYVCANLLSVAGAADTTVELISDDGSDTFTGRKEDFAFWLVEKLS